MRLDGVREEPQGLSSAYATLEQEYNRRDGQISTYGAPVTALSRKLRIPDLLRYVRTGSPVKHRLLTTTNLSVCDNNGRVS